MGGRDRARPSGTGSHADAPSHSSVSRPDGFDPARCQCELYRDIFAEITFKAKPICGREDDPEWVTEYRIPVGPIHRAAGKLGFQMFNGERHMARVTSENRGLRAYLESIGAKPVDPETLAEYDRAMREEVIPAIDADMRASRRAAHFARLGIPDPLASTKTPKGPGQ